MGHWKYSGQQLWQSAWWHHRGKSEQSPWKCRQTCTQVKGSRCVLGSALALQWLDESPSAISFSVTWGGPAIRWYIAFRMQGIKDRQDDGLYSRGSKALGTLRLYCLNKLFCWRITDTIKISLHRRGGKTPGVQAWFMANSFQASWEISTMWQNLKKYDFIRWR